MKKKLLVSLMAAVVSAMMLAGCAESTQPETVAESATVEEAAQTEVAAEASQEVTEAAAEEKRLRLEDLKRQYDEENKENLSIIKKMQYCQNAFLVYQASLR